MIESIRFTYLSSGRDLVRLSVPSPRRTGVVVFADPEFGTARSNGAVFGRLPGTRREADVIRDAFGEPTRIFAGVRATEAALKQLEPPEVLHVATHGFFVRDEGVTGAAGERGLKLVASGERAEVDGLLRSGLALADANAASGEGDDGILTALEAGGLDLSGTQLVVLSACETGVGEATSGRGVQGLRRALVIAGSRTQVMSLWRLHDDAAVAMMRLSYEGLLAGEGRSEALRSAQRQLAKGGEYAHPYYWSGFIVSGEAGPLRGSADTAPPAVDGGCGTCRSSPERDGAATPILLVLALARCRRRSATRRPGSA